MPTDSEQATFDELQRLEQGKMQQLGDRLLPGMHPILSGLVSNGMNLEGKTTKGVPDSMVGDAPATCRAAVEYTTQAAELGKKLAKDYRGVRTECPKATTVVLCTNRDTGSLDLAALEMAAKDDGIDLRIVGGRAIAAWLDQHRQDLRHAFLGIPIGAHTVVSLIHRMQEDLSVVTRDKVSAETLDRFVARPQADRVVREATHQARGRMFLLVAPAGAGKTTWSVDHAKRYASVQPVFWTAATDLLRGVVDPIAHAVAHAAYGSADPARVIELADLLRREQRVLRIIVDAIDEARNYDELRCCLSEVRRGALGPHATVLLTCREEAVPLLERALAGTFPDLFQEHRAVRDAGGGRLILQELDRKGASSLLQKEGATAKEVREIETALPARYRGNALFLRRSLQLFREAQLPLANDGWLEAFAEQFVRDVQRRLRDGGRAPSEKRVRDFLGALALRAIEMPSASLAEDELGEIPGGDEDGENTLLERAIQAGVLMRRGASGIGFTHALFLEHFAARALAKQPRWEAWLDRVRNDSGRQVVLKMIAALPDSVLALPVLLARDPRAACEAAALTREVNDAALRQEILKEPNRLLASHFPSDKEEGIELLKGLRWPEAVQLGAEWFNSLAPATKDRWLSDAADLFLSLEVAGAFSVILWHDGFAIFEEFEWYEPSFCRRIDGLSPSFRDYLQGAARVEVETTREEHQRLRAIKMLAMLRDPWLVDYLYRRVDQGPLTLHEHRAAIYFGTLDSSLIFLESAEKWQCTHDDVRRKRTPDAGESIAYELSTTLGGADVLMFPHEHLVDLAKHALAGSSAKQVSLGHRWAEFLGAEELIEPYYEASRRYPSEWFGQRRNLIQRLTKELPFSRIKALYNKHSAEDIRTDIVHWLDQAPSPDAIDFLIERLEDARYQFNATQSLGILGAVSAGPAIHRVFLTGQKEARSVAAKALGVLRYEPALGDLVDFARKIATQPNSNEIGIDLVWAVIESLSLLGGTDAYNTLNALWEAYPHKRYKSEILRALFRKRDPQGILVAKEIVAQHDDARPLVAEAIGRPHLDMWNPRDDEPVIASIKDDMLLDCVIETVQESVSGGTIKFFDFSLRALAAFDMPRAVRVLESIAAGALTTGAEMTFQAHADPVLEARRLLVERGVIQYEREMAGMDIQGIAREEGLADWHIRRLARWRRSLVREILWERVDKGQEVSRSLFLLQWFAESSDLERFKALEAHEDIAVADIAHRYLRNPRRYLLAADTRG
jgi:hypothetical protein